MNSQKRSGRKPLSMIMIVAAVTLLNGGDFGPIAAAAEINTVALDGTDDVRGPGLGSGALFNVEFFSTSYLVPGTPGAVVFQSNLSGAVSGTGEFYHDGSSNTAQVRTGQQAPGYAAGINVSRLDDRPLGASDGTLKTAIVLTGAGVTSANDRALLVTGPGGTTTTREGEQVPGLPANVFYSRFEDFGIKSYGSRGAIFGATLFGPGVNSSSNIAVVVGVPGSMQVLAREGNQIPNLPVGAIYSGFQAYFSGADGVLVSGSARNGTVPPGSENVMSLFKNGSYTLLGRQNSTTLVNCPGVFAGEFFEIYPSSSEKFITSGNVDNGGVLKPSLVMGNHAGEFRVLVDSDTVLPGTGNTLASIRNFTLSPNGRFAAFVGEMSDAKHGLFRYDTETNAIIKIAAESDAKPDGGTFGFFRDVAYHVNSSGLMAFTEEFSSGTVIYSYGDGAGLSLLVPSAFDVDQGPGLDMRTISRLLFTDAGAGISFLSSDGGLILGDDGGLVFKAEFADGSAGIFTTIVVPEPPALIIALIAALPLLWRGRLVPC